MLSEEFMNREKGLRKEVESLGLRSKTGERLIKSGIENIQQAKTIEFPDDVTVIPTLELGRYLGKYEAYASWVANCLARRSVDLLSAETILEFTKNKIMNELTGQITAKKIAMEADKFYLQCKIEYDSIQADVIILKATLSSIERYSKAISREMSNRQQEGRVIGKSSGFYEKDD